MPPSTQAGAEPERNVYSVSRLNREVRLLLERGLTVLWLQGELSNLSVPSSGHWYFSMKDRDSQVRCAMFRQRNLAVGFTPKVGQHVLARGRVSLYEPRGDYQFLVDHLEEVGVGALKHQFERLKAKLAAEGLFASERKRALPRFPRRIGVITSPSGAAIRDVLHILARRFPPASVLLYPTPVQGEAAISCLVATLELASARKECDVLILTRGGGSLEDLWCFNAERVARAIHACSIPVVSGIGHEVDFTIADFVADARAPTPSGAAELVAPDRNSCLEALARTLERLSACMRRELRAMSSRFGAADLRLKLAHPGVRLSQQQQRLDDLEQRLVGAMRSALHSDRSRISEMFTRLLHQSPAHAVREYRLRHEALAARLSHAMTQWLSKARHRFNIATRTLDAVSPLATLSRGFAVVRRAADARLLTDASLVAVGEDIEAELAHGSLKARVTETGSS
ncbi:MAG TPA: exodeoxyribonuclease VII large subunit [Steroidobacteraceae bacterium]|jgi:exodeoxyribonuclease VII large subunit